MKQISMISKRDMKIDASTWLCCLEEEKVITSGSDVASIFWAWYCLVSKYSALRGKHYIICSRSLIYSCQRKRLENQKLTQLHTYYIVFLNVNRINDLHACKNRVGIGFDNKSDSVVYMEMPHRQVRCNEHAITR